MLKFTNHLHFVYISYLGYFSNARLQFLCSANTAAKRESTDAMVVARRRVRHAQWAINAFTIIHILCCSIAIMMVFAEITPATSAYVESLFATPHTLPSDGSVAVNFAGL